jgi:hypothetical protein
MGDVLQERGEILARIARAAGVAGAIGGGALDDAR